VEATEALQHALLCCAADTFQGHGVCAEAAGKHG
jgi:hypothetical protein